MAFKIHETMITPRIISACAFMVIIPLLSFAVKYTVFFSMPHEYWFSYEDVVPAADSFPIGDNVVFRSDSEFVREASIHWIDSLFCNLDSTRRGTIFFSSYESNLHVKPEIQAQKSKGWRYGSEVPQEPATCHLESSIIATVGLGIQKSQKIIGQDFRIE